jgi:predicted phage gp36 major capsid-like protein
MMDVTMNQEYAGAPETKAAGGELNDAFGEFMTSFEAFRDANDERLSQIERRFGEDVVTSEKVDRISRGT